MDLKIILIFIALIALFIPSQTLAENATFTENAMEAIEKLSSSKQKNFKIKSQVREFVPIPGLALEEITERLAPDEEVYFLIQFDDIPDLNQKKALQAKGINLHHYVTGNTYVASSKVSNVQVAESVDNFLSASPLNPTDKISLNVQEERVPDWAKYFPSLTEAAVPDKAVLTVHFHKNVKIEKAIETIKTLGGEVVGTIPLIPTVSAAFDTNKIKNIAQENTVLFIDFVEPPLETENNLVRDGAQVTPLSNPPYGLSGAGIRVLVYDGGVVDSHVDFGSRILETDPGLYVGLHATHVAGTLGGDGSNSDGADTAGNQNRGTPRQWAGMAPEVNFRSFGLSGSGAGLLYDNPGDIQNDFTTAINNGIDLATMSLGQPVTRLTPLDCDLHGDYTTTSILLDEIVRGGISNQPLKFTKSGGNQRDPLAFGLPPPCGDFGTINSPATAKNPIVVGAITSTNHEITSFTGFGPTDDGRLKPDVVAPGCNDLNNEIKSPGFGDILSGGILNPGDTRNNYRFMCGTSMATPAVAGIVSLMTEQWQVTRVNNPLQPHTAKAILIHTAIDLVEQGPDYRTGWGAVNAKAAIDLIITDETEHIINIDSVDDGFRNFYALDSDGTEDVKVTLVWDDPAATPGATTALVNDLDVRLEDPTGVIYEPYILDGANPQNAATKGDDSINNVEMVIGNAKAGTWKIAVVGSSVPFGPQPYTLIVPPPTTPPQPVVDTTLEKSVFPSKVETNEVVTYTYNETNIGTVPISSPNVHDPDCTPVFQSGDINSNGIFDPGESWIYECQKSFISEGIFTNTAVGSNQTSTASVEVGDCLIATATYGSPMAYEVQKLREIRDNVLLETESGSTFMTSFNAVYYSFSPTIADWERQNETFKEFIKITITPLLSSLSILNFVQINSEVEMLGYGIAVILLNIGMYFVLPIFASIKLKGFYDSRKNRV